MKLQDSLYIFSALAICFSCEMEQAPHSPLEKTFGSTEQKYISYDETSVELDASYFQGEAEILTYTLNKGRYKDVHEGEAILVFVGEDFLTDKQVKNDNYTSEKSVPVLKSNYFQRFTTGVYDYSIMTSTFTPTFYDTVNHSIKVTSSSQDWCGQTFMQLNNSSSLKISMNSYFESEGDTTFTLDKSYLEDEIFNLVRLNPKVLPVDTFNVVPALHYLRTSHLPTNNYEAIGELCPYSEGGEVDSLLMQYSFTIPQIKRTVTIVFDPQDHNVIQKWTEVYPTVFDGKLKTTTATLKGRKKLPYWNLNSVKDELYRDSLNLK